MKKTVYILRGLPGSGKSTVAKALGGLVCSTDDFRYDEKGNYVFDPDKNEEHHRQNFERFKRGLELGVDRIVVDNTNTRRWEYEHYEAAAIEAGYEVHILTVGNPKSAVEIAKSAARNVHRVPLETVKRMAVRFEF